MSDEQYIKRNNTIRTYSGITFSPLNPRADDIAIEDIAHSLSLLCRFAGHTSVFYSVAQHCVSISELVTPQFALAGLLHDGSEAYIVDMPSPVKHSEEMSGYREIEKYLQGVIYNRYGLSTIEPTDVKTMDRLLLRTEQRDLLGVTLPKSTAVLSDTIVPWSPDLAEHRFLTRFRELYKCV